MDAIDGLVLTLIIVSALALFVFVWAFDKIGENRRNIAYEANRAKYWYDRWEILDGKMSKLYTRDYYDFERPKVDINLDNTNNTLNEINKRLHELEKKEVK